MVHHSLKSPFVILSSKCNLNCKYCFYNQNKDRNNLELDSNVLVDFLSFNSGIIKDIILTGGEPFMYKDIYVLLDALSNSNIKARINSNLTVLDKRKLTRNLGILSRVDTTIDHIDPEINDKIRGFSEKTMSNLRWFKSKNIPLEITIPLSKKNCFDIERIYLELRKLKPKEIFIQPVDIFTKSLDEDYSLASLGKAELKIILDRLKPWARDYHRTRELGLMRNYYLKDKFPEGDCQMKKDLFVIDSDGAVYPCFHRHDLRCGNIYSDPPKSIMDDLAIKQNSIDIKKCFGPKCIPLF